MPTLLDEIIALSASICAKIECEVNALRSGRLGHL